MGAALVLWCRGTGRACMHPVRAAHVLRARPSTRTHPLASRIPGPPYAPTHSRPSCPAGLTPARMLRPCAVHGRVLLPRRVQRVRAAGCAPGQVGAGAGGVAARLCSRGSRAAAGGASRWWLLAMRAPALRTSQPPPAQGEWGRPPAAAAMPRHWHAAGLGQERGCTRPRVRAGVSACPCLQTWGGTSPRSRPST